MWGRGRGRSGSRSRSRSGSSSGGCNDGWVLDNGSVLNIGGGCRNRGRRRRRWWAVDAFRGVLSFNCNLRGI